MNILPNELAAEINATAPVVKSIHDKISAAHIPQGVEIPKPDLVFALNGISVFTKKSISTLIGKAKAGKTTVTSWITSNLIKSEMSVLWIDTEQGLYYGSLTQYWVLKLAGIKESPFLQFYDLKIYTPNERIEIIEELLKMLQPDLLILDGIRDLVFDINNPEEATTRTGDLMRWADTYNLHILAILHQNKGNEHARGHLGTEMINKSETVLKVEQSEDKMIVCTPEYTRGKPFDAMAFKRDEHGMPEIVEGFAGQIAASTGEGPKKKTIDPTDHTLEHAHTDIIELVFSKSQFLKYSDLQTNIRYYFQKIGVKIADNKAREFITHYLMNGMVWKNPHIKGFACYEKNPLFKPSEKVDNLNPVGVLSTKINTNQDEEAPF